ncbi:copper homeostasis protein CutC [Aquirufa sp. LEPPI-3A]|uniref:copper homeostasis protein CutC n=1 Tax=Aquirufa regiilacus TaxID=3024868 RepID=UPI0028DD965F|nr:copper homeostasis protein CutC [Aquirufa sp. LEPPI-3A]MDT8888044.1 copper homeostasis protein CutC [Aquirufa sp. LEPPI-3A]
MKRKSSLAVEVCAYSLESCIAADRAGADRVELCASPHDGGCTPSTGLVHAVLATTSLEVHVMLRPRGGDFCYDTFEKQTMLAEAVNLVQAGVHGLVVGALLPNGDLDVEFLFALRQLVGDIPLTCHRAIDVSRDPEQVIEQLIELNFLRILTSGQKNKALEGIENIAQMVVRAAGRIQIMAGSGVNPQNCRQFIDVGVDAIHTSARTVRDSAMDYRRPGISMGGLTEVSEFEIAVASEELIRATIQQVQLD